MSCVSSEFLDEVEVEEVIYVDDSIQENFNHISEAGIQKKKKKSKTKKKCSNKNDFVVGEKYPDYLSEDQLLLGVSEKTIIMGTLNDISGCGFSFISNTESSCSEDIAIQWGKHQNRALHGDVVYISIDPEPFWIALAGNGFQKTGKVVGINTKVNRVAIGKLRLTDFPTHLLFISADHPFPFPSVYVPKETVLPCILDNIHRFTDMLFRVVITKWEIVDKPEGKILDYDVRTNPMLNLSHLPATTAELIAGHLSTVSTESTDEAHKESIEKNPIGGKIGEPALKNKRKENKSQKKGKKEMEQNGIPTGEILDYDVCTNPLLNLSYLPTATAELISGHLSTVSSDEAHRGSIEKNPIGGIGGPVLKNKRKENKSQKKVKKEMEQNGIPTGSETLQSSGPSVNSDRNSEALSHEGTVVNSLSPSQSGDTSLNATKDGQPKGNHKRERRRENRKLARKLKVEARSTQDNETVAHGSQQSQPKSSSKCSNNLGFGLVDQSLLNQKSGSAGKKNPGNKNPPADQIMSIIENYQRILNMNTEKSPKKHSEKNKSDRFPDYMSIDEVNKGLENGSLLSGDLRINPRKYTDAFVSDVGDGKDIIILGLLDRNRALEGDIVAVKLKPESEWMEADQDGIRQKTATVVHILVKVHSRICVGTISMFDTAYCKLVPRDFKFPRLLIPKTSIPTNIFENLDKHQKILFSGTIVNWDYAGKAFGVIKGEVGMKGLIDPEIEAILLCNDIDSKPLSESLLDTVPTELLTEKDIAERLDLRDELIFSIDPETARDLDDCVSYKELPGGFLRVGVHISDVSHALHESTPLDVAVSKRATSVYLPHRVIHMLPPALTARCSLLPGQDKPAFSVIWTMDKEFNIIDTEFRRTVINNAVQLSYDHAQIMLEGSEDTLDWPGVFGGHCKSKIAETVRSLGVLARALRERRFENGALRLDQPKVCFRLNADCRPVQTSLYLLKESNRLIEELMLLANMSVATKLRESLKPLALLRNHPPPKLVMLNKLVKGLKSLDIEIDSTNSATLQRSLLEIGSEDPSKALILSMLLSKPMQRALYFCNEDLDPWHYALSVPLYTHFTSPIRRYADVVVHRLLASCLGLIDANPEWSPKSINNQAKICNKKKESAKKASDVANELFVKLYIKDIGGCDVDAVVFAVYDHSFDVLIECFSINVRIFTDKLDAVVTHEGSGEFSKLHIKWNISQQVQIVSHFCCVRIHVVHCEKLNQHCLEGTLLPPS